MIQSMYKIAGRYCSCKYVNKARERWINTEAYRDHEQKAKNYTKEKRAESNDGLLAIFAEFARRKSN